MSTPPSVSPPSDRLSDYFKYLAAVSPTTHRVWAATTEAEFSTAVGEVVDDALKTIHAEGVAATAHEPGLSRRVVQLLSAAAVPCGAETGLDGRVIVTVKHPAELAFTVRRALGPR
ncbi:MAG TPA: hypothetical protein VFA20_26035 [Myxococcaceae bacterium]|nr:hypothetical protein [Myxococcaceae bacterium]